MQQAEQHHARKTVHCITSGKSAMFLPSDNGTPGQYPASLGKITPCLKILDIILK